MVGSGIEVFELTRDTFDLRAYYRDRVQAERVRRTGVQVPVPQHPDWGEP